MAAPNLQDADYETVLRGRLWFSERGWNPPPAYQSESIMRQFPGVTRDQIRDDLARLTELVRAGQ